MQKAAPVRRKTSFADAPSGRRINPLNIDQMANTELTAATASSIPENKRICFAEDVHISLISAPSIRRVRQRFLFACCCIRYLRATDVFAIS